VKKIINRILSIANIEIRRIDPFLPGSPNRPPYGSFRSVLEDYKARGFVCNSIVDIGAHTGSWSRLSKSIFRDAKHYLIEPLFEMQPKLEEFCNEFPDSKYFMNGAGSKDDYLTLTVYENLAGSTFIPDKEIIYDHAFKKRSVKVVTINGLLDNNEIEIPELIKIDVQGFELEVLRGATKLLGTTELIMLEVSLYDFEGLPLFAEVVDFMDKNGYVVYDFAEFSRRPYDGALGQCDVIFAKKNGFLRKHQSWN
jgi:FkbM family methyltransferase